MKGFDKMSFCLNQSKARYQLRYAAGIYWLLDMEQPGVPYQKPLPMNETGAEIWHMLGQGMSVEDMAKTMSQQHGVSEEDVRQDIQQFLQQLQQYHITI